MASFNNFLYFTLVICILPLAQGAGEFCNLETKCKNPDEKCHVFFERFYYEAGYCGPRSCTSDSDCSEITVTNDYGPDETFSGKCACDQKTTCSYTVGNTYCPEEPTPRIKEAYEDVQGFENCLKEVFIPDSPTPNYCLPAKKPKNCLQQSWLELQTLLPSVDALEECYE